MTGCANARAASLGHDAGSVAGGRGLPQLSMLGKALLKDAVLLGAALLTVAESWGAG